MHAIETQLTRDFLRKGRWCLLEWALLAPLNILGFLLIFSHIGDVSPHELRFVFHMTILVEACGGTAVMGFVQSAINQVQLTGGFPARLYTLPVSTARLVLGQMAPAIVLLALLHLADAVFFRFLTGVLPPLVEPILFLAALYAGTMAVVWSLPQSTGLRVLALALAGLLIGSWVMAFAPHHEISPETFWASPSPLGILGLALLTVGGYFMAVAGVRRDRCGEPLGFPLLAAWLNHLCDLRPQRTRPFASPQAAQFWLERCQKGWIMPAGALAVVILILGGWVIDGRHAADDLLSLFVGLPFYLVPAVALIAGLVLGRSEVHNSSDLDLFRATRPLSDHALSAAMHKTGALNILSSTAILLAGQALTMATLALAGHGDLIAKFWAAWSKEFSDPPLGLWAYPALLLLALLASWIIMSLATVLGQAGHGRLLASITFGMMALVIGFVIVQFGIPREVTLQIIHGALIALGGCGVLGSAWAIGAARRRRLIGPLMCTVCAGLWVVLMSAGFCFVYVHGIDLHFHLSVRFFFACVASLAPATPALGALALSWNRHR